ncbi:MAG: hypothetical protein AAFP89_25125 [Bacteroidota bacterium]
MRSDMIPQVKPKPALRSLRTTQHLDLLVSKLNTPDQLPAARPTKTERNTNGTFALARREIEMGIYFGKGSDYLMSKSLHNLIS